MKPQQKQKRCRICKEKFTPFSTTSVTCSMQCAIDLSNLQKEKKAKVKRVEFKKSFRENDLSYQLKTTQPVFNKMRVLEELQWFKENEQEPTCISCGGMLGGDQWSCGHFKTRGSQSGLRFDRVNTYLQHNVRCNSNLSGDIEGTKTTRGYKVGLVERFGEKEGRSIIDYCESNTEIVKWTCAQLIEMRKEFNKKIREMKALEEL